MTHRYRHTAMMLLAVGCTCLVAACGSSSSSSSSAAGPGGARQGIGLKLTAGEQACLKKHGVKAFTGGAGRPGANPGSGTAGGPPSGGRPSAAARRRFKRGTAPRGFGGAAQRRQQAALKACGVSLPSPGAGAGAG